VAQDKLLPEPDLPKPVDEGVGEVAKGRYLFNTLGCMECHSANGRPNNKSGPDLLMAITRAQSREWMHTQLVDPKAHNAETLMPAYDYLSQDKISALLDFLVYLGKQKPMMQSPWEAGAGQAQPVVIDNAQLVQAAVKAIEPAPPAVNGQELFRTAGCMACHTVSGQPSNRIGPDLILALRDGKRSRDWLYTQLLSPAKHFPNTRMPSYMYLGDVQITGLVDYLDGLGHNKIPVAVSQGGAVEQMPAFTDGTASVENESVSNESMAIIGDREHGEVLFRNYCVLCHGPEGKVDAPGFLSMPGVPGLNPIDRDVFDPLPDVFIGKIDPILQHGVHNTANGPSMPAFGDRRGLTQPQIADVEAYVLYLNKVDRARINAPGVPPEDFFYIVLGISIVLGVLLVLYWYARKMVR
jgi:mono/diheme cytochrome c family protein